ncbi:Eukaryotic translation initiation factor 3 subunit D [Oryzias melastigma]|uniref:Eukaryotic translation initiation factor 3 subunit D n=1 Tax=Oryzias melastigma TaxID=30732 RepID=A0A834FMU0_ORYME|nr:Eukaryotic translation initiation factor 3 subunit D [Oryzias melastigma]
MAKFQAPVIQDNPTGWGPCAIPDRFKDMPYQPFSKGDRLGKVSDWTGATYQDKRYPNRYTSQFGGGSVYAYFHEENETTFQLVDTAKTQKTAYQKNRMRFAQRNLRRDKDRRNLTQFNMQTLPKSAKQKERDRMRLQKKFQKQFGARQKWDQKSQAQQKPRDSSVEVRSDWEVKEEMDFPRLMKMRYMEVSDPEDIECCGALEYYDKAFDRITTRNEKTLRSIKRIFHTVTTTDDPVIRKLAKTQGNVFATDAILATLMCCTRSVNSWDIIVQRVGNKLFFDKRDSSDFDLLTVSETANEPPQDEVNSFNSPRNLAMEATYINHNFSQQCLRMGGERYKFPNPNPFVEEDMDKSEVASVAYRYRHWKLGEDIDLIVRCEHDGVMTGANGEVSFINVKTLNEWDSRYCNGVDWRQKLDSQRGAVLATELKNNSYKLARWTCCAMLAGSEYLKLGYVSRYHLKDSARHVILGTQQFKPNEFASQINLSMENAWGILRCVIDICRKLDEGKYLILKDPNKQVIRVYSLPDGTFSSDEDEEEDDDEEDVEEEEEAGTNFIETVNRSKSVVSRTVMAKFQAPVIQDNPSGWGPCAVPEKFKDMPYQPFSKGDRLGKVADWTGATYQDKRYTNKYSSQFGGGSHYAYFHEEDETSFQLVDTAKTQKTAYQKNRMRFAQRNLRRDKDRRNLTQFSMQTLPKSAKQKERDRMRLQKKFQKQFGVRQKWDQKSQAQQKPRDSSVEVRSDWEVKEEMDFPRLMKMRYMEVSDPEDIECCGALEYYDKAFDRITTRNEKTLRSIKRIFHTVTTTDDPVIRKLAKTQGNVFATDAILATLMCCTRSVNSWDIIVQRVGNKLFFDKRDSSDFDLLTVSETANEPPQDEGNSFNSPRNLAMEATYINHNFSQQCLRMVRRSPAPRQQVKRLPLSLSFVSQGGERYKFPNPNPFVEEDMDKSEVASVAYRYRHWKLGEDIDLIVRCEHDGVMTGANGEVSFINVKTLNEWDSRYCNGVDWRQKLDSQRGAVLATELKNNSYKLARWTCCAMLAGSEYLKLGYVSRYHVKDSARHVILGTQQFKPNEFASQINLSMENAWGILRCVIDICRKLDEGKYLILKDPNKQVIRVYSLPDGTFSSDEDEEEDDDEEDEEEEDEEN